MMYFTFIYSITMGGSRNLKLGATAKGARAQRAMIFFRV